MSEIEKKKRTKFHISNFQSNHFTVHHGEMKAAKKQMSLSFRLLLTKQKTFSGKINHYISMRKLSFVWNIMSWSFSNQVQLSQK